MRRHKPVSHIVHEHKKNPLYAYIREIIYGGNDGIITTFAVVAGFGGANLINNEELWLISFAAVLLFGLANLFADGVSIALGSFLSIRAEKQMYKSMKYNELNAIKSDFENRKAETVEVLCKKGFDKIDARVMANVLVKNKAYWTEWILEYEMGMPNPDGINPFFTGLSTFISFVGFGFIPLIPFLLKIQDTWLAFIISLISTFSALILLGVVKWKIVGGNVFKSVGDIVVIGSISALVAFCVGTFFAMGS